ncbi:uncharacterized protein [Acropora muricata]|uniref:uncharacterized protein n=1 Tax=Acropora muricata TaxID=159855 RepID=UPI0034E4B880
MIHVLLVFVVLTCYESYTQNLVSAAENVSAGEGILAFHSISTECFRDHFTILLSTKLIPNVDDAIFLLNGKRCRKRYLNSSHIIVSFKPSEYGTTTDTYSNGWVIYTSLVTVLFEEHEGLKKSTKVLKVQCMFKNATTDIIGSLPRQNVTNSTNAKELLEGNEEQWSKNVTVQSSDEIRMKNDQSSDSKGVNHDNVTEGEPEDGTEISPVQSSMEKIRKKTVLLLNGRRVTVAEDAQTEKSVPFVESLPGSSNRSSAKKDSFREVLESPVLTTANVTVSQKLDPVTFTADQRTSTVVRNGDKMTIQAKLSSESREKSLSLAIHDCYTSPHAEKEEENKDIITFIKSG